jgi:hypothetical protein
MAIEFVGVGTLGRAGTTSSDTIDLTDLNNGISSTAAAGDFVIAAFSTGSNTQRTLQITDGANNYTEVTPQLYSDDTYDVNLRVAYKFMGSTPDTATTFGGTGSVDDAGACLALVFRGVNPDNPIDITVQTATGINTANHAPPTITPATAGAWPICLGASGHNGGTRNYFGDPTPYNAGWTSQANDTYDTSLYALYKTDWTSGSVVGPSIGISGDATTFSYATLAFALRPVGGNIKVWNGSAWVAKPVKVWNGSAWVTKPLKRWNGSAWITTPY